jgi:hypothetical protein
VRGAAVFTMCLVLAAAYVTVLLVPATRDFALAAPSLPIVLIAACASAVAIGGLAATSHAFIPGREARAG